MIDSPSSKCKSRFLRSLRAPALITLTFVLLWVHSALSADYAALHNVLIDFYSYQRAGTASGDPHNPFYTRSPYPHASDSHNGRALDGGWYDAGDFVKFGLPLGYSAYCLLKGYEVFPNAYDDRDSYDRSGSGDGIPDVLNQVKVATDYLLKAVINENTIVMDVGDAGQDHQQLNESGYQNSSRIPNRTVYLADGADVPGLYAAALALMAKVYAEYDNAYAQECLTKAREAFTFCTSHRKISSTVQKDWNAGGQPYYGTDTWADKMACGAVELYRVTGEDLYVTWAKDLMATVGQHYYVMGYANCGDLAAFEMVRLGEASLGSAWLADVNFALGRVVPPSINLVGGVFVNSDWGVCRDAANAAFSAALAYMVKGESKYRDFAFAQIDWLAGFRSGSRSYVVRYNSGPTQPHHRNDLTLGNKLRGGIVSGPTPQGAFDPQHPENSSWSFTDSRDIYKNTEVALDYNAGAIGAVAFIRYYNNPPAGLVRITEPLKATPDLADFNDGPVSITAGFEKSLSWKIVLSGRTSNATKTFNGSGSSVRESWNGGADEGTFQVGEVVDLTLEVDNIAEYHRSRASAALSVVAMKTEEFRSSDVLVDDFDDGDLNNKLGGKWSGLADASEGIDGGESAVPLVYPSTSGKDGTGAVLFRLTVSGGAAHPYAGVRTTFNSSGGAVSLGRAQSVVFDVKASTAGSKLRVELEEPSNTGDGGHHGAELTLAGTAWHRIRIPFTQFSQPQWAANQARLNTGRVSALRFVLHGEGTARFTLDNVHIEGLDVGDAPVASMQPVPGTERQPRIHIAGRTLRTTGEGKAAITVLNVTGRTVQHRSLSSNKPIRLSPGCYLLGIRGAPSRRERCTRVIVP